MIDLVKIAVYKLRQYGERGVEISLPKVFQNDNGMEFGEDVEIYRGTVNGKDALVIFPAEKEVEVVAEETKDAA